MTCPGIIIASILLCCTMQVYGGSQGNAAASDSTELAVDTTQTSVGETVAVESITLARDDSGSAGVEVDAPSPSDRQFHAVVLLNEAGGGRNVKVDLIAVDAGGEHDFLIVSSDYLLEDIDNQVDVTLSLPRDWPTGRYRVDAYVNGQLSKSKEFTIQ